MLSQSPERKKAIDDIFRKWPNPRYLHVVAGNLKLGRDSICGSARISLSHWGETKSKNARDIIGKHQTCVLLPATSVTRRWNAPSWMTTAKEEIGTRTWWHLQKSSFIKAGVNGIRPTRPSGEMIHRTCCHSSIVIYYFFEFL